jgi:hypothetical protein
MAKNGITAADLDRMPEHIRLSIAKQLEDQGSSLPGQQQQQHQQQGQRQGYSYPRQRSRAGKGRGGARGAPIDIPSTPLYEVNEYGWKTQIRPMTEYEQTRAQHGLGVGHMLFMLVVMLVLGGAALMLSAHHGASFHYGVFK